MGHLSTHVLDTVRGGPAAGMQVALYRIADDGAATLLQRLALNADGRSDAPLLQGATLLRGRYRLLFSVAAYFRAQGHDLPEPPFLDEVPLDFGIAEPDGHYHVPLLATPWSFATYRGS